MTGSMVSASGTRLSETLRAERPEATSEALEGTLRALCERVQREWPGLAVPPSDFVRHLARCLLEGRPVEAQLEESMAGSGLHLADLYLAYGCAKGDAAAQDALNARVFPRVFASLDRLDKDIDVDELLQQVRMHLLMPAPGTDSPLLAYRGRGSLANWLRAVALRLGLRVPRGQARPLSAEDLTAALNIPDRTTPESALMKGGLQREFRAALETALGELSPRERNVLQLHALDGHSLEEIGILYRVHNATVSRWLASARQQLLTRTSALMQANLKLAPAELDGIFGMLESDLNASLRRLLTEYPPKN